VNLRGAYGAYLFAVVLFGTNGVVAAAVTGLDSLQTVMFRTMLGGAVLLIVFLMLGKRPTFKQNGRQYIMLLLSGISMGVSWMFQYESYREIGVGTTSLVYCMGPAILMALAPVVFGEKMTWNRIAGFSLVMAGALFLSINGLNAEGSIRGYFCGAMTAIAYVSMVVFNKKAVGLGSIENPTFQLLFAFITVLVCTMLAGDLPTTVESCDILPLVALGVVNTGFGCLLYFSAIPLIDAQTVAICDYIEPASAVLFSVIFLGEALGTDSFIGMLLIFCGVIVGEVVSRRTPVSGKDYCSGQNGHRGPRGLVLLSEVSMGCCPCSGRAPPKGRKMICSGITFRPLSRRSRHRSPRSGSS